MSSLPAGQDVLLPMEQPGNEGFQPSTRARCPRSQPRLMADYGNVLVFLLATRLRREETWHLRGRRVTGLGI